MACFASYRRSGWVRVLVLILCALFIFATIGAPPAHALGVESVAVFGLASVLSAATAALGFKLASNEQGQATLQKMVQDFKTVAWATGFVLVGSKLNGLQNGMDYIKMQVQNGKTYLDERVFAWVQQWLAENGVYDSAGIVGGLTYFSKSNFPYERGSVDAPVSYSAVSVSSFLSAFGNTAYVNSWDKMNIDDKSGIIFITQYSLYVAGTSYILVRPPYVSFMSLGDVYELDIRFLNGVANPSDASWRIVKALSSGEYAGYTNLVSTSNSGVYTSLDSDIVNNDTGLTGTDTLGKDVIDLTLDQILQKLKDWAQDWFDAGADSATNAATGALDLPLTVSAGAATANPSIAEDGPLVWFPPFSVPIPNLRTGETDTKTVDQGKENASAAETSTVDVAENQTVIDSLVNWALSYISPDTGLFSRFPLCVPYDAYLLVTSSLGVDAVGSDSIFGASPGDLEGVVSQDIDTYSDFQPIINIKHDFELDGVTYPLDVTIDLTPWQPFVTFFREGMALLLIAELIGSEFKRIRGH